MEHGKSQRDIPSGFAVEQWQARHKNWAIRRIIDSLEECVDPDLKAIRDHAELSTEGINNYLQKLQIFGAKEGDWTNEAFAEVAKKIEQAQNIQGEQEREIALFEALHDADYLISHVMNHKELLALENPGVAAAFIEEVLVDKPQFDEGITPQELQQLLALQEAPRSDTAKLVLTARIVHQKKDGMTSRGIYEWFDRHFDVLDGATPMQVIKNGTSEEKEKLFNWVRGGRSQLAT